MKNFKTFREVIQDPQCAKFVVAEIQSYWKQQNEALAQLPAGSKLKMTAYFTLDRKGILNPEDLIKEMELIDQRKSELSSLERRLIKQIVWNAMAETINYYK